MACHGFYARTNNSKGVVLTPRKGVLFTATACLRFTRLQFETDFGKSGDHTEVLIDTFGMG